MRMMRALHARPQVSFRRSRPLGILLHRAPTTPMSQEQICLSWESVKWTRHWCPRPMHQERESQNASLLLHDIVCAKRASSASRATFGTIPFTACCSQSVAAVRLTVGSSRTSLEPAIIEGREGTISGVGNLGRGNQ